MEEIDLYTDEARDLMTKAALEADIRLVRIEDGRLEVALERSAARSLINDLSRKAAYRIMLKQAYGRYVFTSSASALFGNVVRANYAAAKAGLIGLMHAVAIEGARAGILANAVLPVAASRLVCISLIPVSKDAPKTGMM